MKTSIQWLILSLALVTLAGPAAAQKAFTFEDAAAQLVDWAYADCRPERIPPPPKPKTSDPGRPWWSFSSEEAPKGGPKEAPRVVNAGFHTGTTKLSEAIQQHVVKRIEQELSRIRFDDGRGILVRNPAEAGLSQDFIHDAFGSARGNDVGRKLEAAHFDFIMRASGVFIKGGSVLSVHFLLDTPAGGCQKRTLDVLLSDWPRGDATPDVIIEQAVSELFQQDNAAKAIKRIAILPPTIDSAIVADESRDALGQLLAEALRKSARPSSRSVGGEASSGAGLPIVHLGKGEFFDSATRGGDWLAQLRFTSSTEGMKLAVDFFEIDAATSLSPTPGLIDAKYVPKAEAAPITFVKDQLRLRVGKDQLQFQLKVQRPAMAFCLTQEADGETTLLYPNTMVERSMEGIRLLQPRAEPLSFPNPELRSELATQAMGKPAVFLMRCMTARERPIGGEISTWMSQTPGYRAPTKPLHISGSEFVKLWSSLRKLSGSREILTVVHVTKDE